MTHQQALIERNIRLYGTENLRDPAALFGVRRINLVSQGRKHGPMTRLVSPTELGELIKPFVFLDLAEITPLPEGLIGIHPHSGVATLTTVLRGGMLYEDSGGKSGTVRA